AGGSLRRRLRGVPWDRGALGSLDPPVLRRTLRRERAGATEAVRAGRRNIYIHSKMTTNNAGWSRGWFYLRNYRGALPAFTNPVLREAPGEWGWGGSPHR